MVWREELQSGQVLLRDIIDLDATYGGVREDHSGNRGARCRTGSGRSCAPEHPPHL